ncbi:nuclear speckle splicing regulatory protein 1-like [Pyrus ussuriensis x Pyrus communis]|uniref:Nuclear speckle splicing regulatory protein 1-like n=1 Tax=Pyrus ussuriensis x Pyrus communis TaxID=2448454 RepID=A0A5N5F2Y5_9ROSA|nr:nuclear speckle splicing regulatory protein 1-like [Pyrus ussuriensis x Pyrus communis]
MNLEAEHHRKKKKTRLNLWGQQKKQPTRPPLPKPRGFGDDDDDNDPSNLGYKIAKREWQGMVYREKQQNESEKQEIIYERKLQKEQNQEDHLYADKERFSKPNGQRKIDCVNFRRNLQRNVAFGAEDVKSRKPETQEELSRPDKHDDRDGPNAVALKPLGSSSVREPNKLEDREIAAASVLLESLGVIEGHQEETLTRSKLSDELSDEKNASIASAQEKSTNHHKRSADDLAAARECYLARKRPKES